MKLVNTSLLESLREQIDKQRVAEKMAKSQDDRISSLYASLSKERGAALGGASPQLIEGIPNLMIFIVSVISINTLFSTWINPCGLLKTFITIQFFKKISVSV